MDDPDTAILLAVIIICIILSAYFSSTETAFSSLNKIRLKNLIKNNVKGAELAYDLSEQFDKVLSTILIGNNIVNIVSASLSTIFFTNIMVGNESLAVTTSTAVMTIVVLIFGEITPKTLAKEYPEKFAIFSSPILRFFMIILTPLNFPFKLWKKLLNKIFHFKEPEGLSDEELITIVEDAEEKGALNEYEGTLIRSAIEFDDCEVIEIFTPRADVVAISKFMPMEEIRMLLTKNGYSRLPVYEKNMDQIVGFIHQKDFHHILHEGEENIESIIKPIYDTIPQAKISEVFRDLQKNKSHIAVVVDEFGSTMGIITVEDIIEELVGDIWDEHDAVSVEFDNVAENKYVVLCSADLEGFFETFKIPYDAEKFDHIQTVSGWVLDEMKRVPKVGDKFTYEDLEIIVSKIDFRRILEIEVFTKRMVTHSVE